MNFMQWGVAALALALAACVDGDGRNEGRIFDSGVVPGIDAAGGDAPAGDAAGPMDDRAGHYEVHSTVLEDGCVLEPAPVAISTVYPGAEDGDYIVLGTSGCEEAGGELVCKHAYDYAHEYLEHGVFLTTRKTIRLRWTGADSFSTEVTERSECRAPAGSTACAEYVPTSGTLPCQTRYTQTGTRLEIAPYWEL